MSWDPLRPAANAGTKILPGFVETRAFEEPAATAVLSLLLCAAKIRITMTSEHISFNIAHESDIVD